MRYTLLRSAARGGHDAVAAGVLGLGERGVGATDQALERLAGAGLDDAGRERDAERAAQRGELEARDGGERGLERLSCLGEAGVRQEHEQFLATPARHDVA